MNLYTEQAGYLTRHRADDLRRLRAFRLLDDDFMIKVFEDKSCVEFLLQIILNRKDLKVQSINSQYSPKNLQGRSICLDILALDNKEDSKGVTAMCKAMEDMRNEAVHEHAIESAKAMIASGKLTQEEIAIFSGLTLEEIKSLIPKYPA